MSEQVYFVVELAIKPGELDNFKGLTKEMVEATQANEPDTLNYEWTINEDNTVCHIYERYTDSAAVMAHVAWFGQNFAEKVMTASDITRFTVYGNPNEAVRETLGGFGAVFMSPIGGFAR